MKTIIVEHMGIAKEVAINDQLGMILEEVASAKRGRFAYVENHVSGIGDPKCTTPGVSDKWFISLPRYDRYLERVAYNVGAMDFFAFTNDPTRNNYADIQKKLSGGDMEELFNEAKAAILKSVLKTQEGDRSDGFRRGHDACYAYCNISGMGVTLHLQTEDDGTGHKRPAGEGDYLLADSIMLPFFLLDRRVHVKAVYKPTNSKALTLMKDAIKEVAGIPEWNAFSLGKGNFSYISLDSKVIIGKVADMTTARREAQLAAFVRFICELTTDPFDLLVAEAQAQVTVRA